MKVTKGLIAAAGWSTRFLPSVKTYAKHLVPVWDKPNIQYQVEAMLANGINQICIVHRPGEETIYKHFQIDEILEEALAKTNKSHLTANLNQIISQAKFTFIPQSPTLPYGNATPILAAKDFLSQDPFVYFYGDDLIIEDKIGQFLGEMLATFDKYQPAVVAAVQPVDSATIQKLSTVKYKENSLPNQIEAIVEKPTPEQIYSLDAMVSPFVMSPQITPLVENLPVDRGEIWATTAINMLDQTSIVLAQKVTSGQWATTGDPQNWLISNILMATRQNPELKAKLKELIANL